MKFEKLKGLIPAAFTPFDQKGEINLGVIDAYAHKLIQEGAYGVFVCGSTGEMASMTCAERKRLSEKWKESLDGRIKLIVHVGSSCQKDSIELAKHAQGIGADGIAALAPFYFKPATPSDMADYFVPVAAAAPELPFYFYNIPSMSGVNMSMLDFLKAAELRIPNLAGIKFTHNNFMEMKECIDYKEGRYDILNGFDEMLLAGLAFGAQGGVGSTFNYALGIYHKIMKAFASGDMLQARAAQAESIEIVKVIIKHGGGVRGGKAIMNHIGIPCGDCRPPFCPVSDEEYRQLALELRCIDF